MSSKRSLSPTPQAGVLQSDHDHLPSTKRINLAIESATPGEFLKRSMASPSGTRRGFDTIPGDSRLTSPPVGSPSPRKGRKKLSRSDAKMTIDRTFRNLRAAYYQTRMKGLNADFKNHLESEKNRLVDKENLSLNVILKEYVYTEKILARQLLRKPGNAYTFGSGDCNQLGHGDSNMAESDGLDLKDLTVKRPRLLNSLKMNVHSNGVVSLSCGGQHNAAVMYDGKVYTWGCNDEKALGRNPPSFLEFLPKPVDNFNFDKRRDGIISVSTGDTQTVALSLKGEVYTWGCYRDVDGKPFRDVRKGVIENVKGCNSVPLKVDKLSNVMQIACGASHNAAVTKDGTLYTWGAGVKGNLARDVPPMKFQHDVGEDEERYDLENIKEHHVVPYPVEWYGGKRFFVRSVACGANHIIVIAAGSYRTGSEGIGTEKSDVGTAVFTAGLNNYGQLGLGDIKDRNCLTRVKDLDGKFITGADGGSHHTLCHNDTDIYAFGRGCSGQLGISKEIPEPGQCEMTPKHVPIPDAKGCKVDSVSCGDFHSLALFINGQIYSWGYGEMAQLGHGKEQNEALPRRIKLQESTKGIMISGGGQHSGIICCKD